MLSTAYQLALFPSVPDQVVEPLVLQALLSDLGVLGAVLGAQQYAVGEQFLDAVSFLGCSPAIELIPQAERAFCYIELPEPSPQVQFWAGLNLKAPRCPSCKADLAAWVRLWRSSSDLLLDQPCLECGGALQAQHLNWRKSALLGRSRILIANIHESEAVPAAALLDALERTSSSVWKYAYLRWR